MSQPFPNEEAEARAGSGLRPSPASPADEPRVRLVPPGGEDPGARLRRFRPGMKRQFGIRLGEAAGLPLSIPLLVRTLEVLATELVEPLELQLGLVAVGERGTFHQLPSPSLGQRVLRARPFLPLRATHVVTPNLTRIDAIVPEAIGSIERWLRESIATAGTPPYTGFWESLYCPQALVRVPDSTRAEELTFGGGRYVAIEEHRGGRWVWGSISAKSGPPVLIELSLASEVVRVGAENEPIVEYAMELALEFCWSLWTEPNSPGRALVDEVAEKLEVVGWSDWGWRTENPRHPPPPALDRGRIVIGEPIRACASDEVHLGAIRSEAGLAPALVTLTWRHAEGIGAIAESLRYPFPGIAPLEWIGHTDPGVPFSDAIVERLPPGARPATHYGRLRKRDVARVGAGVASVLVAVHGAGELLVFGVQPSLIYVATGEGLIRFACLAPRAPNFVASAPRSFQAPPRSYRVPYWAPEVFRGEPEQASDVFALCASLYTLGTGRHAFGDPSDLNGLISRILWAEPDPWPGSAEVGAILRAGMAARAADRPSAAELLGMLGATDIDFDGDIA